MFHSKQSGQTLISALISVAIAGITAMIFLSLSDNMNRHIKTSMSGADALSNAELARQILSNPMTGCSYKLKELVDPKLGMFDADGCFRPQSTFTDEKGGTVDDLNSDDPCKGKYDGSRMGPFFVNRVGADQDPGKPNTDQASRASEFFHKFALPSGTNQGSSLFNAVGIYSSATATDPVMKVEESPSSRVVLSKMGFIKKSETAIFAEALKGGIKPTSNLKRKHVSVTGYLELTFNRPSITGCVPIAENEKDPDKTDCDGEHKRFVSKSTTFGGSEVHREIPVTFYWSDLSTPTEKNMVSQDCSLSNESESPLTRIFNSYYNTYNTYNINVTNITNSYSCSPGEAWACRGFECTCRKSDNEYKTAGLKFLPQNIDLPDPDKYAPKQCFIKTNPDYDWTVLGFNQYSKTNIKMKPRDGVVREFDCKYPDVEKLFYSRSEFKDYGVECKTGWFSNQCKDAPSDMYDGKFFRTKRDGDSDAFRNGYAGTSFRCKYEDSNPGVKGWVLVGTDHETDGSTAEEYIAECNEGISYTEPEYESTVVNRKQTLTDVGWKKEDLLGASKCSYVAPNTSSPDLQKDRFSWYDSCHQEGVNVDNSQDASKLGSCQWVSGVPLLQIKKSHNGIIGLVLGALAGSAVTLAGAPPEVIFAGAAIGLITGSMNNGIDPYEGLSKSERDSYTGWAILKAGARFPDKNGNPSANTDAIYRPCIGGMEVVRQTESGSRSLASQSQPK